MRSTLLLETTWGVIVININWKVRALNPAFWGHIAAALMVPILTYFGYSWDQMTTWDTLFQLVKNAVSNPVVVFSVGISVWNTIFDPTTKGLSDCEQTLQLLKVNSTQVKK